jgi:hypothetical protein
VFGYVQWDSPLALLLEFLFALVVFGAAFWLARRVESRDPRGAGSLPLGTEEDVATPEPEQIKSDQS